MRRTIKPRLTQVELAVALAMPLNVVTKAGCERGHGRSGILRQGQYRMVGQRYAVLGLRFSGAHGASRKLLAANA